MTSGLRAFAAGCLALMLASTAAAQGVQTGTLRGTVSGPGTGPLPGVTVTATSPALQGDRQTVTDETGVYVFPALPAGDYTVEISMPEMRSVRIVTVVPLGGVAQANADLALAAASQQIEVVGRYASSPAGPIVGVNYRTAEIDALATPRTLAGIAALAPAVTQNGPNAAPTEGQTQVVINGGFAYDNVFMLNGVDVNDNIFGWPQNLFVEDAIAETQVLTSGIPAEYGRFTGGVINAVTKSGSNRLSGSYRLNLSNDAWSSETPFEQAHQISRKSHTNGVHEFTFGGPLDRDRLWFFGAGRYQNVANTLTLPSTAATYQTTDRNTRGELKLTGSPATGQTLQASVLADPRQQQHQANLAGGLSTIDPAALSDKQRPNHLFVTTYRGALSSRMLVEGQYSQQKFSTDLGGGTSRDIVDSPMFTFDFTRQYNAPYFDRTDPDERNNRQVTGSLTYLLRGHEFKSGYEWFRSNKVGGNSQSSTGYVFLTDYATDAAGLPVYDAAGRLIPLFVPGETQIFSYGASRGAELNVDTQSAYAQDHWTIDRHLTADLGVRFEHVASGATVSSQTVSATRLMPRFSLALDPRGDGVMAIHGTVARYSGRYSDALMTAGSPVGHPSEIDGVYVGPAGKGRDFASGFAPGNYDFDGIYASFPTANIRFSPDLSSPVTSEFTASAARTLGRNGSAEATYVYRRTTNLIEDYIDLTTGTTHIVQPGVDMTVSNRLYANSQTAFREYQGLVFQGHRDLRSNWSLNGHWTVQLKNDGNYEGESSGQIGATMMGDYPEIFTEAANYPTGHLASFQRHKVDVWSVYDLRLARLGDLSLSGLWRYNSGRVYSLRATSQPLTATQRQILASLGYVDAPSSQTVYFSTPGSEQFAGYGVVDTSVTYTARTTGRLRPWVKFEAFNLLNNQTLISWNTTIRQDPGAPINAMGLRTSYLRGPLFGQATGNGNYPAPFAGQTGGRTVRIAVGVRF